MNEKTEAPLEGRRDFLKKASAVAIGGVITLVPIAAGARVVLDPLKRGGSGAQKIRVTNLDSLPKDGIPRKFPIVASRTDAWNRFPDAPVGAVYLRRSGDTVEALNVVCPHAGCFVDFRPEKKGFLCPCHNSLFELDGKIRDPKSPSPRALDRLLVEIRNDTEVWVEFQNYRTGTASKNSSDMKKIFDWLDHRTGVKKLTHEALYENIPGGARWRYVWGSTLTFALVVQFITGIFLWMAYSPSSQTAWESVFYIQNEMAGGWLLRGIHHYMAQLMTILLALHLMQTVIDGAYKAPREINFWFGLILLQLTLALSLTGYLLPWDQKGYWATKVSTNIAAITPFAGPMIQKIIVGGSDYGHHTLTRFFALHAGVLPGAIVVLLIGHIYLFRRHGITAKEPLRKRDQPFWPEQVLVDSVACLAVLVTVLFLIVLPRLTDPHALLGAELGAPADPSEAFSAARPEWYFLFLFQFLKYFPGESEIWGAMIIPGIFMGIIFLMPFLGKWKLGHRFNLMFLCVILIGAGLLTYLAKSQDRKDLNYVLAVKDAEASAERVQHLAKNGIPPAGALSLLKNDPLTQGPKLFANKCSSCHRYDGHDGLGQKPADPQSAADLKNYGSRAWLTTFLSPEHIASSNYFGGTRLKDGKMVRFVKKDVAGFNAEQKQQLAKVIKALSAEASLKSQANLDKFDLKEIQESRALLAHSDMRCTECHQFRKKDEDATAPDLTGWASRAWMADFIKNPAHDRFYGKRNDRMQAFGDDGILDERQIGLIVDWLRGETSEPVLVHK